MTNIKTLGAALALLVLGATAGWNASNVTDDANANPAAAMDTREPATGSIAPSEPYRSAPARRAPSVRRGISVPAGTPIVVAVNGAMSSKSAQAGDSWSGVVTDDVDQNGRVVIPAGSPARGTVSVARTAARGDRATLQLALTAVSVNGRSVAVHGSSEAIVAGSPRTRNLGAIAGGAAAGALLGKAIGHSGKSTVIGAVVGGTAATAAVAASKGYQATIPAGKAIEFTTVSAATVRA